MDLCLLQADHHLKEVGEEEDEDDDQAQQSAIDQPQPLDEGQVEGGGQPKVHRVGGHRGAKPITLGGVEGRRLGRLQAVFVEELVAGKERKKS